MSKVQRLFRDGRDKLDEDLDLVRILKQLHQFQVVKNIVVPKQHQPLLNVLRTNTLHEKTGKAKTMKR